MLWDFTKGNAFRTVIVQQLFCNRGRTVWGMGKYVCSVAWNHTCRPRSISCLLTTATLSGWCYYHSSLDGESWPSEITYPESLRHCVAEPGPLIPCSLAFTAVPAHSISGQQKLRWWLGAWVPCGQELCQLRTRGLVCPGPFPCGHVEGACSVGSHCPSPVGGVWFPRWLLPPSVSPASACCWCWLPVTGFRWPTPPSGEERTHAALASAVFSTCRAPLSLCPTSPMCISSSCCLVNPHISSGIYWPLMIIRWNEMNKRMVNETLKFSIDINFTF